MNDIIEMYAPVLSFENRGKLLLPPKNKEGFVTIVPQRTLYVQLQLRLLREILIVPLLDWVNIFLISLRYI